MFVGFGNGVGMFSGMEVGMAWEWDRGCFQEWHGNGVGNVFGNGVGIFQDVTINSLDGDHCLWFL